jgi:3-methyl-2-oxobutanoate hydroxymethyltransferase
MTTITEKAKPKRITVPAIGERKTSGKKIVALTAYDYTMAKLIDGAGVDMILVGDSAACIMQGHSTTLPITLDEMLYHARCVSRGVEHSLVVGDLPFLSYQVSIQQAVESAGRMLKEAGVGAVKLEGGLAIADTIAALVNCDIPVVGHVGLTPQSYHRMGGHRIQGKAKSSAIKTDAVEIAPVGSPERIFQDAIAVEEAGAFAIVLEGIPSELASKISKTLSIPTIGIGAGCDCDGQILVAQDMLGMLQGKYPSFVKRYCNVAEVISTAVERYVHEVRIGEFPEPEVSNVNRSGDGCSSSQELRSQTMM